MMDNRNTEKSVPSHWHKQNIGHHDEALLTSWHRSIKCAGVVGKDEPGWVSIISSVLFHFL